MIDASAGQGRFQGSQDGRWRCPIPLPHMHWSLPVVYPCIIRCHVSRHAFFPSLWANLDEKSNEDPAKNFPRPHSASADFPFRSPATDDTPSSEASEEVSALPQPLWTPHAHLCVPPPSSAPIVSISLTTRLGVLPQPTEVSEEAAAEAAPEDPFAGLDLGSKEFLQRKVKPTPDAMPPKPSPSPAFLAMDASHTLSHHVGRQGRTRSAREMPFHPCP